MENNQISSNVKNCSKFASFNKTQHKNSQIVKNKKIKIPENGVSEISDESVRAKNPQILDPRIEEWANPN